MGFWNIVLAVVVGAMFYRIGVNIANEIVREVKWNKSLKESSDVTHITLHIPYANLDENKVDINQFNSLVLDNATNEYVADLKGIAGRLTISEVKKIADEYGATSYIINYAY